MEEADRVRPALRALIDVSEAEAGAMTLHREAMIVSPFIDEPVALHSDEAE